MIKRTNNSENSFNFSAAMKDLEDITNYLESPDVELDKAVDKFKRGTELANDIREYLESTENIIQSIKADNK